MIQEFKVQNNSFSAEYGNNGGTVLNIMMKQGGNQFHGSGWWFGQRDAFDANDFFSNQAGFEKPPHVHDQYGGAISGPIKKNKAFFLFDFEKQRDVGSSQVVATMPTALQRNGDFSQTMTYDEDGNLAPVTIYNPCSIDANGNRQPFANNVIPPNLLDPVAKKLLAYFPEPNVQGDAGTNFNNYRRNVESSLSAYQFDIRGDLQFNNNHHMGLRYSRAHAENPTSESFVSDGYLYKTDVHNAVVDYNWTINPSDRILGPHRIGSCNRPGYHELSGPHHCRVPEHPRGERANKDADDRVRSDVHEPLRSVLRGHPLQPQSAHLLLRFVLGKRVTLD